MQSDAHLIMLHNEDENFLFKLIYVERQMKIAALVEFFLIQAIVMGLMPVRLLHAAFCHLHSFIVLRR